MEEQGGQDLDKGGLADAQLGGVLALGLILLCGNRAGMELITGYIVDCCH